MPVRVLDAQRAGDVIGLQCADHATQGVLVGRQVPASTGYGYPLALAQVDDRNLTGERLGRAACDLLHRLFDRVSGDLCDRLHGVQDLQLVAEPFCGGHVLDRRDRNLRQLLQQVTVGGEGVLWGTHDNDRVWRQRHGDRAAGEVGAEDAHGRGRMEPHLLAAVEGVAKDRRLVELDLDDPSPSRAASHAAEMRKPALCYPPEHEQVGHTGRPGKHRKLRVVAHTMRSADIEAVIGLPAATLEPGAAGELLSFPPSRPDRRRQPS